VWIFRQEFSHLVSFNYALVTYLAYGCAPSRCYNFEVSQPPQQLPFERKAAAVGRAAGQIAGQQIQRNRWLRGLKQGITAAGRTLFRVVHVLWLQVTGFFFVCFAVIGAGAFWRQYQLHASQGKLVVIAIFTVMFAWFGITSFWRAHKR
jgi:hypothetical protein